MKRTSVRKPSTCCSAAGGRSSASLPDWGSPPTRFAPGGIGLFSHQRTLQRTRGLPRRLSRRGRTRPGPPQRGRRATPRRHEFHPRRPSHPLLRKSQDDPRTPGPRPCLLGKSRRPPHALGRPAGQARKAFPAKDHRGGGRDKGGRWTGEPRPDHAAHPSPNLLAQAQAPTAPGGTHLVSDIWQRPAALPCGLPAAGYLAPDRKSVV